MKLFDVYPLFDITPVRAAGCQVMDDQGKQYLDFYGGHAVISIGHSHPHFVAALRRQLQELVFYSNSVQNPLQHELARKLGRISGCDAYQLFLCNSGAEANENALKLASFSNGRSRVIAFGRAFHGRTSAAVNITDNEKIKAPINRTFDVEFHTLNQIESVARSLSTGEVCAVIIEGIQGIGGIHVPQKDFLRSLHDHCKKSDTILILDEIQSGYGRSGEFFAFQHAGLEPDLITVAKGMGNGFPIGAVLIHPGLEASYGLLGTTFGGNHLACAAGIAVLDVLEKEVLIPGAGAKGDALMALIADFPGVRQVRGKGLMIGIELDVPAAPLRKRLLYEGHIFTGSSSDPNVIRLLPPLSIGQKDIDQFLEKFGKFMSEYC